MECAASFWALTKFYVPNSNQTALIRSMLLLLVFNIVDIRHGLSGNWQPRATGSPIPAARMPSRAPSSRVSICRTVTEGGSSRSCTKDGVRARCLRFRRSAGYSRIREVPHSGNSNLGVQAIARPADVRNLKYGSKAPRYRNASAPPGLLNACISSLSCLSLLADWPEWSGCSETFSSAIAKRAANTPDGACRPLGRDCLCTTDRRCLRGDGSTREATAQ
jgi:hypothetical protein